jgi:molybdate transport system substrate-binding protein
MTLSVLCAGAAKGLVLALAPGFTATTGVAIDSAFGAVGALRDSLLAGAPCDALVLTSALMDVLERDGHVVRGSAAPLGAVRTGIAVRAGEPVPDIHDGAALRAALARASQLFFPDPQRSTAGIHFAGVLTRLGIDNEVADRCATFPNGATAMLALAQSNRRGELGCTQVTEINYTPGIVPVGALPEEFDLATVYVAAVCVHARDRASAHAFVQLLTGPASRDLRTRGGFEV